MVVRHNPDKDSEELQGNLNVTGNFSAQLKTINVINGKVGIGTIPTGNSKIHIKQVDNTIDNGIKFERAGGTAASAIGSVLGTGLAFGADTTGNGVVDSTWMIIDDTGDVGIGTTNPEAKLHLKETGNAIFLVEGTSAGFLRLKDSGGGANLKIFDIIDDGGILVFRAINDDLTLKANRMVITGAGNVGIGTINPYNLLHVAGTAVANSDANAEDFVVIENNGNANLNLISSPTGIGTLIFSDDVRAPGLIRYDHNLNKMELRTNSVLRVAVDSDGNVGIGTQSPNANALLDVSSTTKAFMPPRMTTTQRDAIASPTAGMVIYNSSTNVLNFYNGSAWGAV